GGEPHGGGGARDRGDERAPTRVHGWDRVPDQPGDVGKRQAWARSPPLRSRGLAGRRGVDRRRRVVHGSGSAPPAWRPPRAAVAAATVRQGRLPPGAVVTFRHIAV